MLSTQPRVFVGLFTVFLLSVPGSEFGWVWVWLFFSAPFVTCLHCAPTEESQSVALGAVSPCSRLRALPPVPVQLTVRASLSPVRLWVKLWSLNILLKHFSLNSPRRPVPGLSLGLTSGRTCYTAVLSSASLGLLRMHCLSAFLLPNSLFVLWQLLCHFFFLCLKLLAELINHRI